MREARDLTSLNHAGRLLGLRRDSRASILARGFDLLTAWQAGILPIKIGRALFERLAALEDIARNRLWERREIDPSAED